MKNLWQKDRKTVFKELYAMYLEEGYSSKEAKKLASKETDELLSEDESFAKYILDMSDEPYN